MSLADQLYAEQDEEKIRRIWKNFPFLDPSLGFLESEATTRALREGDKNYPFRAIKFNLFPEYSNEEALETFRLSIFRGVQTVSNLCSQYLGLGPLNRETVDLFIVDELPKPLDLFELVKKAAEDRERFVSGSDSNPQLLVNAYSTLRAIELGYRACIIDESSQVSNSLRCYRQVVETLGGLLGFKNPRWTDRTDFTSKWDTVAGVSVLSSGEKPMKSRLKYLTRDDPPRTEYSSILIKLYSESFSPEEIKDYIGVEMVVENEEEKRQLVGYIMDKTSLTGTLENYKDTTLNPIGDSSSPSFMVTKFIVRIPCAIGNRSRPLDISKSYARWHDERGLTSFERFPVEVQIFTAEDYRKKESVSEASHDKYRKRQFRSVLPALFPKQIYEPILGEV